MAQTVRLDGGQVDKLVELIKERKEGVLSGEITGLPHNAHTEIEELDGLLYALGEDEDE